MAADYVRSGLYILRHLFFRLACVYRTLVSIEVVIGLRGHGRPFACYCCLCSMLSIASDRGRPDKYSLCMMADFQNGGDAKMVSFLEYLVFFGALFCTEQL